MSLPLSLPICSRRERRIPEEKKAKIVADNGIKRCSLNSTLWGICLGIRRGGGENNLLYTPLNFWGGHIGVM